MRRSSCRARRAVPPRSRRGTATDRPSRRWCCRRPWRGRSGPTSRSTTGPRSRRHCRVSPSSTGFSRSSAATAGSARRRSRSTWGRAARTSASGTTCWSCSTRSRPATSGSMSPMPTARRGWPRSSSATRRDDSIPRQPSASPPTSPSSRRSTAATASRSGCRSGATTCSPAAAPSTCRSRRRSTSPEMGRPIST